MSEDVIKIEVDDTELDILIAKLKQAMSLSTQAFETRDITKGASMTGREMSELRTDLGIISELKLKDLPSINREMRLLLGQLPGARAAIQVYFRLKRLARGFELGGFQLYITLAATALIMIRALEQRIKNMERRQLEYESYIRRERGLTKGQYDMLMEDWQSYFRSSPG